MHINADECTITSEILPFFFFLIFLVIQPLKTNIICFSVVLICISERQYSLEKALHKICPSDCCLQKFVSLEIKDVRHNTT